MCYVVGVIIYMNVVIGFGCSVAVGVDDGVVCYVLLLLTALIVMILVMPSAVM